MDPFYVDHIKIMQDVGIVTVKANANDTKIIGFSKGKIEKITGFNKNQPEIHIKTSKLNFSGKYMAIANVLGYPLNGQGTYNVQFSKF